MRAEPLAERAAAVAPEVPGPAAREGQAQDAATCRAACGHGTAAAVGLQRHVAGAAGEAVNAMWPSSPFHHPVHPAALAPLLLWHARRVVALLVPQNGVESGLDVVWSMAVARRLDQRRGRRRGELDVPLANVVIHDIVGGRRREAHGLEDTQELCEALSLNSMAGQSRTQAKRGPLRVRGHQGPGPAPRRRAFTPGAPRLYRGWPHVYTVTTLCNNRLHSIASSPVALVAGLPSAWSSPPPAARISAPPPSACP